MEDREEKQVDCDKYGEYGRKASRIVIREGQYGTKAS